MAINFRLDQRSNTVAWVGATDDRLTEEQAMIVSVTNMAWAMSAIAEALSKIAVQMESR